MAIDTGPGGFEIDGKTLTFDTEVDNKGQQDISTPTKKTLADYLSNVTKGIQGSAHVPNDFPVDPGLTDVSTEDEKGNPTSITPTPNSSAFAPDVTTTYSDQYPGIQQSIKKGKSSRVAVDGNALLTDVSTTSKPIVDRYVSSVLSRNRFTVAAPVSTLDDVGNPPKDYNPTLHRPSQKGSSVQGEGFTLDRLANVGPILTTRASLELGSTSPGYDPNSTGNEAAALLPGIAQLAVQRVNQRLLTAHDVLQGLTTDETSNFISPGTLSWGVLNNVDDPFSGLDALGMAVTAAALVAGLIVVVEGLSTVVGLITTQAKHATHDAQGRYAMGSFYADTKRSTNGGLLGAVSAAASANIGVLLGIQPTNFPFSVALRKGTKAFFGIDTGGGLLATLGGAATKGLTADAGFNTVVARTIIRSSLTIIDSVKKIGGNPINATKHVLALVDVLKTSKLISACNVFAQLGDALLSVPDNYIDTDAAGQLKVSAYDKANPTFTAASKNRLPGSLKLAWAGNRAPAMYLVPSNVVVSALAGKNIGAFDTTVGALSGLDATALVKVGSKDTGWRIATEDVEAFEKQLDAEYVPFYFHDVRTNEIISFHAFLTSLTDDFKPEYESSDAYGRVEPVRIYKGTTRTISVSFWIVATSLPDFDAMWTKINKLVTMVYPQYTAGKQLQDKSGDYVFTQPFSQLIGASPMVRLRLGDLFKSNYSRFGLARLFGLGDTNFTLNNQHLTNVDSISQGKMDALGKAFLNALKNKTGLTFVPQGNIGYARYDVEKVGGLSISVGSGDKPTHAPTFWQTGTPDMFMVKIETMLNDNVAVCTVEVNDEADFVGTNVTPDKIHMQYGAAGDFMQHYLGGKYVIPVTSLRPSRATVQKIVSKSVTIDADTFATELDTFLRDTGSDANAVAKSFRDTGGKGLAGFIGGLNFNWYDQVTWETGTDRRAPKMCKVTIEFMPIHDISPGLDHRGFNRAPVYAVGTQAPRPDPIKRET
jgi:hypothetical protein